MLGILKPWRKGAPPTTAWVLADAMLGPVERLRAVQAIRSAAALLAPELALAVRQAPVAGCALAAPTARAGEAVGSGRHFILRAMLPQPRLRPGDLVLLAYRGEADETYVEIEAGSRPLQGAFHPTPLSSRAELGSAGEVRAEITALLAGWVLAQRQDDGVSLDGEVAETQASLWSRLAATAGLTTGIAGDGRKTPAPHAPRVLVRLANRAWLAAMAGIASSDPALLAETADTLDRVLWSTTLGSEPDGQLAIGALLGDVCLAHSPLTPGLSSLWRGIAAVETASAAARRLDDAPALTRLADLGSRLSQALEERISVQRAMQPEGEASPGLGNAPVAGAGDEPAGAAEPIAVLATDDCAGEPYHQPAADSASAAEAKSETTDRPLDALHRPPGPPYAEPIRHARSREAEIEIIPARGAVSRLAVVVKPES